MKHLHKLKDFIRENHEYNWEELKKEILEEFEKLSVDKKLEVLRELEDSMKNEEV